jgi:RHS repeat-associated protein
MEINGAVGYIYDNVGNRQQITSTLAAIPAGQMFYDNNDRLTTDQYDNNGNTTVNGSIGNTYDFENHLVQHGAVTIAYDGDGNRVTETAGGITTQYLIDTLNPTGYAQVVEELQNSSVTRRYSYGLERLSESQFISGTWQLSFYGYDGHGSVRVLTNSAGAITDTYDYDAFGVLIASTGSTPNNYLFAGEQFDPALRIYYNRARYYDERNGRFWSMDTDEGSAESPRSIHKYLYLYGNPVNEFDPSGLAPTSIAEADTVDITLIALGALAILATIAMFKANPIAQSTASTATSSESSARGAMRIQLQSHKKGANDFTLPSPPLNALDNRGVRVIQTFPVLDQIYIQAQSLDWFSFSTKVGGETLDVWLLASIQYLKARLAKYPPGGITGFKPNFEQAVSVPDRRGTTYRIDVDNLVGWNLRLFE